MLRTISAAVSFVFLVSAACVSTSFGDEPTTRPQTGQGGFLFVTFKGEQTPMTEQVYFGLSQDGFQWSALNKGDPVLVSTLGEKGVRDPYILRSHDNKKFYIIATDLSINLNKDWRRAQRAGSKSIMIWESEDLAKWSEPRLVKVAPDDAGCTWAPEAIYDEDAKDYMVYWASPTERDNFAKQRIWAAHTKDFKEFSKPEIYIERPRTIIDTDIVRDGKKYYRFSKDGYVTMESADHLAGPWNPVEGYSSPQRRDTKDPPHFFSSPRSLISRPRGACSWIFILAGRVTNRSPPPISHPANLQPTTASSFLSASGTARCWPLHRKSMPA